MNHSKFDFAKTHKGFHLLLRWAANDLNAPVTNFVASITGALSKISTDVGIRFGNGFEYDDLSPEECLSILKTYSNIMMRFVLKPENSFKDCVWTVEIIKDAEHSDRITGVDISVSGNDTKSFKTYEEPIKASTLLWLPLDHELTSPMPVLAIPYTDKGFNISSFHGLVVLASRCAIFEQALLNFNMDDDKIEAIGQWHDHRCINLNNNPLTPVVSFMGDSLWGLEKNSDGNRTASGIFFESLVPSQNTEKEHNPFNVTIPLEKWRKDIDPLLTLSPLDIDQIQNRIHGFAPIFKIIRIHSINDVEPPNYMAPPLTGTCLTLKPTSDAVLMGLDFNQASPQIVDALLHGLGHILLAHIRPKDDYGHSDSMDSIQGRGYQKRWDKKVRDSFPVWFKKPDKQQVTSLEECSAKEKATLGLWRMIGEVIGESRNLHQKAETYQDAMYQRQAAQRLLAQLIDYSGAMLCDGVGLGKTYVATTLIVHFANTWRESFNGNSDELLKDPYRITILAPNSVVSTWQREALPPLAGFGVPLSTVRVISHSKMSRISRNSSILEQPSPRKQSDLEHLLLSDLVIADEAHNFRSISARRTVVLRDLLRLQPRKDNSRKVLLLTATPVNNSLDDLQQEASLMFSRPILLSDASTVEGYRRQAVNEIAARCKKAVGPRAPKGDVSPLIIHGDAGAKFSEAKDFRDDLDFGPNVQRIGDYLKEQDKKLKGVQEDIRNAARLDSDSVPEHGAVRIADELLDRIVVQRSRNLCKEIENQQGSQTDILFRPDADKPETLYYSDEYDGIKDVLGRFLLLFDHGDGEMTLKPSVSESFHRSISLKVYMWYDVKEGFKTPDESSSVVGLQRILVLKRLESSPVSFLITLLRLTVLHAHRLQQLLDTCTEARDMKRAGELTAELENMLDRHGNKKITKIRSLITGDNPVDQKMDFIKRLGKAYMNYKKNVEFYDVPKQLSLFGDGFEDNTPKREELERIWLLKEELLQDMDTLLAVTPDLADIVFGKFQQNKWPHYFIAGGDRVDWPDSSEWGMRIVTDAKIRQLIARLLKARRQGQKVIVFSQFTDSLAYIYSVLKACNGFERQDWSLVLSILCGLGLEGLKSDELKQLLKITAVITGDTEERDSVVNAFSPFYRIGPHPPSTKGTTQEESQQILETWKQDWLNAIASPIDVLLSTDVLAEGVNLQDVAVLINFDVHWNPVRMIQRAGRIDRRLNPAIENALSYPELDKLAVELRKPTPSYFWHDPENKKKAPLIVNMILPDELEAELNLRERISTKTLAIDFTLGLEQGTGAEAGWMENYKYQGVSSLNAFQKDRAIEQVAAYHRKMEKRFEERGIKTDWVKNLNGWFREEQGNVGYPIIGRVFMGKKGGTSQIYSRYLEPELINGVPHWLWSQQKSGDSILNFWLALDTKSFPPKITKEIKWKPDSSLPVSPEHLLYAAITLIENESILKELPPQEVGRPLLQGITALSAGFLGTEMDRAQVAVNNFFLLQLMKKQKN